MGIPEGTYPLPYIKKQELSYPYFLRKTISTQDVLKLNNMRLCRYPYQTLRSYFFLANIC